MRLELSIRPASPISREVCDREVSSRLRNVEKRGPDLEGDAAISARVRSKPWFGVGAGGEPDKKLVEKLDVALDFGDARDVEPLVEWCFAVSGALSAPVCADNGTTLGREAVSELLGSLVQERKERRRAASVTAIVGVAIMVAGGFAFYGMDEPDIMGANAALGVSRHVHFVGVGAALVTVGMVVFGGALSTAMRD